ncbi:MAG: DUF4093 domain-containing protein [Clostridia bacterium]|nr:DUF4093 domain-containing protein [Clostridia bacterium]
MDNGKLTLAYPVIVEGKYDKIRLSNIIDTQIIVTDGFGIFKKAEKQQLLRKICEKSPVILLCDSDGGGKIIRSHLTGMLPRDRVIQLYIPQIRGKEKRKSAPSAAGLLGVEGMDDSLLRKLFLPYTTENIGSSSSRTENSLTLAELYEHGLAGRDNSQGMRDELCASLGLPSGMSAKALLEALRLLLTHEEYLCAVGKKY